MKYRRMIGLATLTGLLLAAPGAVYADDCTHKLRDAAWQKVSQRLDINQNQQVEVEEFAVRLQQFANGVDRDGDGVISQQELRATIEIAGRDAVEDARVAWKQQRQAAVASYVRDFKDNLPQAKAATAAIKNLDLNKDQRVSQAEVAMVVNTAFRSLDADGDGNLSDAELRQAMRKFAKEASAQLEARLVEWKKRLASK